jgi:hypothetical protein
MPTVSKYIVKEAFELDGVMQEVDAIIELDEEKAQELGSLVAPYEEPQTPSSEQSSTEEPPVAPSATEPSSETSTPSINQEPSGEKEEKGWAGEHTVGTK